MPTEEDLLSEVLTVVAAQFPEAQGSLRNETDLYDLGLDSTSAIELMMALESRFGVSFPDSLIDEGTFASPGALCKAIASITS